MCIGDLHQTIRTTLHPLIIQSIAILARAVQQGVSSDYKWTSPMVSRQAVSTRFKADFVQTSTQETALQTRLNSHASSSDSTLESPSATPSSHASASSAALALFGWYPYSSSGATHIDPSKPVEKTDIVTCRICQRRIGLWAFTPSSDHNHSLDLVQEHLEWCPIRCSAWWEGAELLKEKEGLKRVERDWLRVSELLEEKPWRKRRRGGA